MSTAMDWHAPGFPLRLGALLSREGEPALRNPQYKLPYIWFPACQIDLAARLGLRYPGHLRIAEPEVAKHGLPMRLLWAAPALGLKPLRIVRQHFWMHATADCGVDDGSEALGMRQTLPLRKWEHYTHVGNLRWGGEIGVAPDASTAHTLTPSYHIAYLWPLDERVCWDLIRSGIASLALAMEQAQAHLERVVDVPYPWAPPHANLPRMRSLTFDARTDSEVVCGHCQHVFAMTGAQRQGNRDASCPMCEEPWRKEEEVSDDG